MSTKSMRSNKSSTSPAAPESVGIDRSTQDEDPVPAFPEDIFSELDANVHSASSSRSSSSRVEVESPDDLNHSNVPLSCTWPSRTKRYSRDIKIRPFENAEWKFQPYKSIYDWDDEAIPKQWEFKAHPEGQPYYRSYRGSNLYLTEADVSNSEIFGGIEHAVRTLQNRLRVDNFEEGAEVLLEWSDGKEWSYYMVLHDRRIIFWVHPCDCSWLADDIGGVKSKKHLKQRFEVEYWNHVERFPHHIPLSQNVICELLGVLSYNTVGSITAPRESIYSFSAEEMKVLRDIVHTLDGLKNSRGSDVPEEEEMDSIQEINSFVTSSLARLMALIGYERFANFHGEHGARLSRLQSIRPSNRKRTLMMTVLSPTLFFAPDIHLKNIEEVWIDQMVLQEPWKEFIANLVREWEGFVLYSTVLLNANVAFLAIPVVAGQDGTLATPAEIASQVSMITSVGSIIIGLLLSRHHQLKDKSAEEAARYMGDKGLQTLAILYSLPYALLMWSMVTFVLSIAITCFDVRGVSQRVITGVIWLFICLLIGWAVVTGWMDSASTREEDKSPLPHSQSVEGLSVSIRAKIGGLMDRRTPRRSDSEIEKNGSIRLKTMSGSNLEV
ncbi:hypothetical protein SCHPADRAFT_898879 [Schizopora paradoxa]|uniref:WW domain-containing protein n=1 Tax=Schizopora paradoxa TaxID=27342 RepID=A0A0H2S503_9AGAM|nr:hypothetical protein SCHPADRAFT_898879 [Schizopora paradoxa]